MKKTKNKNIRKKQVRRPGRQKTYTDETIRAALLKHDGLVQRAAKAIGCARKTIYARFKENPGLAEICDDFRSELIDLGEAGLRYLLKKKDKWAIAFVLETLGKDRGYVKRSVSDHNFKGNVAAPTTFAEWIAIEMDREKVG